MVQVVTEFSRRARRDRLHGSPLQRGVRLPRCETSGIPGLCQIASLLTVAEKSNRCEFPYWSAL